MIEQEFIPYQEALTFKELGFNEPCHRGWDEDYKIWYHPDSSIVVDNPTFSQAFRWFDEHTDLMGFVVPSIKDNHFDWLIRVDWEEEIECEEAYSSRIEAELACLRKLIEIANEKLTDSTRIPT